MADRRLVLAARATGAKVLPEEALVRSSVTTAGQQTAGSVRSLSRFHGSQRSWRTRTPARRASLLPEDVFSSCTSSVMQERVRAVVDSRTLTLLTVLLTLYALFGNDVKMVTTDAHTDIIFDIITLFTIAVFTAELVMMSVAHPGYIGRTYFWVDLLCTLCLFADITWCVRVCARVLVCSCPAAAHGGGAALPRLWTPVVAEYGSPGASSAQITQTARASTRADRLASLIRSVQLLRLTRRVGNRQSYTRERNHSTVMRAKRANSVHSLSALAKREALQTKRKAAKSRIGTKLSDLTNRRVIVTVLVVAAVSPLLQPLAPAATFETARIADVSMQQQLQFLSAPFNATLRALATGGPHPLVTLTLPGLSPAQTDALVADVTAAAPAAARPDLSSYRPFELLTACSWACYDSSGAVHVGGAGCVACATFDVTGSVREEALFSVGRTLFVLAVLYGGSLLLTHDANELLVKPIELMVKTVRLLAENPLAILTEDSKEPGCDPAGPPCPPLSAAD